MSTFNIELRLATANYMRFDSEKGVSTYKKVFIDNYSECHSSCCFGFFAICWRNGHKYRHIV